MKIIVLGAGVIGVSSAYYLASQGHDVIVIDKNKSCGLDCSYANGGQLSYSHISTWASEISFRNFLQTFISKNSYSSFNSFNQETISWLYKFYKNSNNSMARSNSQKLYKIASYSRYLMTKFLDNEDLDFSYTSKGILHIYRNKTIMDKAISNFRKLDISGIRPLIYSADQCVEHEPNLIKALDAKKLAGGILFSDDALGNAYNFTVNLEKICREKYGVKFIYETEVKNLLTNFKKITGVNTFHEVFTADAYVHALGYQGDKLLKGINIYSDIYPIKGYSLTTKCSAEFIAPSQAITDIENKIVYSRLGDIFRVAGIAEFGANPQMNKNHLRYINENMIKTFANYGDIDTATHWSGIRPFRPNSLPLICNVQKYPNLYLNTGHGSLGWTLALASAKILSDILDNKSNQEFDFLAHENIVN
jgi:D-amino-acid dehydrogenase